MIGNVSLTHQDVEGILVLLNCCDDVSKGWEGSRLHGKGGASGQMIAGGEVTCLTQLGPALALGDEGVDSEGNGFIFGRVDPKDLPRTWSASLLMPSLLDGVGGYGYVIRRLESMPVKAMRGHRLASRYVARSWLAEISADGRSLASRCLMNWSPKGWLELSADPYGVVRPWLEPTEDQINGLLCGIAFSSDYWWTVDIQHDQGPAIRFRTDPAGARRAFKMRDVPPGKKRRGALRNWVSGHFRRKVGGSSGESEDARSWVRRHLRGSGEFGWDGYKCRLNVAPAELREWAKVD